MMPVLADGDATHDPLFEACAAMGLDATKTFLAKLDALRADHSVTPALAEAMAQEAARTAAEDDPTAPAWAVLATGAIAAAEEG